MTNGELFMAENPNIEFKLNGSCVWIYFDGVNHYTMPISWWEQEIRLFDKIRSEIKDASQGKWYVGRLDGKSEEVLFLDDVLQIIDKHIAERSDKE